MTTREDALAGTGCDQRMTVLTTVPSQRRVPPGLPSTFVPADGIVGEYRVGWPFTVALCRFSGSACEALYPDQYQLKAGSWIGRPPTLTSTSPMIPMGSLMPRGIYWPGAAGVVLCSILAVGIGGDVLRFGAAMRRIRDDRCWNCAYDVGKEIGVCPECGSEAIRLSDASA